MSRVAFLGPEGTFTHRAALAFDPAAAEARRSIRAVIEAVAKGEVELGVVPAENVLEGPVLETLDALLGTPAVFVVGERILAIEHVLIGRPGREVKRIYSHPQALAQCREWLEHRLPDSERLECLSTAEAAALAASDPNGAAIGAGPRAGLEVLATGLARAENHTRFFAIGRCLPSATGADRTLVTFAAPHRPGALHACLAVFAEAGINLSRIESRPSRAAAWTYRFLLELDGHPAQAQTAAALAALQGLVSELRVLGAWATPGRAGSG